MEIIKTYVEYRENPLGIDVKVPRFSWTAEEPGRDVGQTARQIQTSADIEFKEILWDSGKVISPESVHVPYGGSGLKSCTRYYYRIRVWNKNDEPGPWSRTGWWETGIMDFTEWEGEWITPEYDFLAPKTACPMLHREFCLKGKVRRARAYVTAKGDYELYINGNKAGDAYLTPGWTSYNKRLLYQTYDVTDLLSQGKNAAGAMIGSGWYKGELGWRSRRNLYGGREALILEIHVEYEDGTKEKILSDSSWKSSYRGPVIYAEHYHGETYDARKETEFSTPGLDTSGWFGVRTMGRVTKSVLRAQECESVKIKEILRPVRIIQTPKGEKVLDMGQNMTGWVRFRVKGCAGSRVILSHAEMLDPEGNFYTDNLKGARQRIEYILKGDGEEVFRPHFTFQGFRYVKIEEFPGEPDISQFEGLVLYSDLERTGEFACSDPLLNKLYENALWSQKGNFVDIPSDCPQRCERLGWTADIQVFAATAAYNMRIPLFLSKWLHDLAAEQYESGGVPWVVPDIYDDTYAYDLAGYVGQSEQVAAAWGDAATICPWTLYQHYGDIRILEEQYDSMKKYVEFIYRQGSNPYTWDTGHQLGDWVALDAPYGSFIGATDTAYVASAYYARSAEILYKAAQILGRQEDACYYKELHEKILAEFRNNYVRSDGSLSVRTQTAIVLALQFGLVQEEYRQGLADELAEWLKRTEYDLITGFVGTPYICHVLTRYGHPEAAYGLLMKKDYPSWLYQVTKGATTVWEHLDGLKPDGTMWNPRMNSFNHYAYGSVAEWLYSGIGGIAPTLEEAGYKKFLFAPQTGGGLMWASVKEETMYGMIEASWEKTEENGRQVILYRLKVPAGTTAEVWIGQEEDKITESGKRLKDSEGIRSVSRADGRTVILAGSGVYNFTQWK